MSVHFVEKTRSAVSADGLVAEYEDHPVLSSGIGSTGYYRSAGKRFIDILLVLLTAPVAILLLLPMVVCVASDGSNPFFSQMRLGRGGRVYRMWKLRTMVPNAEDRLQAHLEADPCARAEWIHSQKLKQDPRITRCGGFLRRSSLDELPQLWNVLRGDMSLVGPRPMLPEQRALYPGRDYEALRPGLTGTWQVSSRNESAFADRARFDTQYNRSLSFTGDVKLMLATVRVVCRATGH